MEFGTIGFFLSRIFEAVILYFILTRTIETLIIILAKIIKWIIRFLKIKIKKRKKYKKKNKKVI